jgi:Sulfotransferase family
MEKLISHIPGVKRGHENPSLENAISRTFQGAGLLTNHTLEHLPPQFYGHFKELYTKEITKRAATAKVFTNTHPVYIHDAIRLTGSLPNARFLLIKRNIEDICLRIYFRKYYRGNSYAYDLNAIREHVLWYYEMIDTLAAKLPTVS